MSLLQARSSFIPSALLLLLAATSACANQFRDIMKEKSSYTYNNICLQKNCINPLFPALDAMPGLEQDSYECQEDFVTVRGYLDFCYAQVTYDFALPQAKDESSVPDVVNVQEQKAVTYFAYHLAGMGYEFHDFLEPWKTEDECVKSVWRLTCLTMFPSCNKMAGKENYYHRPCKSTCLNYLKHCGVECCDESVGCVFNSEELNSDGSTSKQAGYVDHMGPSPLCTGSANRNTQRPGPAMITLIGASIAALLHR